MKLGYLSAFMGFVTALIPSSHLLAQLPDDPDQMLSWMCTKENDQVLVEAREIKGWKSILDEDGWNCEQKTADIATGTLQFNCEPSNEDFLGLITFTWISGEDEQQQMGQWVHQLAAEQSMICTLARTEIWDQFDQ